MTNLMFFQFSLAPSDWAEFQNKQEKLDVCQIPEAKLTAMTTRALLETVLNYPFIHDYLAFNSLEVAFSTMYGDFNGLRALLERKDATEVFLNSYSYADVMTSTQYNLSANKDSLKNTVDQFFLTQTLEFLISCDQMKNGGYTAEEYKILNTELAKKESSRWMTGLYSSGSNIYENYVSAKSSSSSEVVLMAGENFTYSSVTTPKGSSVSTFYNRNPEYTSAEKTQMNNVVALNYPDATRLREPTVKYNCHSYAWYSQSTSL